jgi:hypothetical protein
MKATHFLKLLKRTRLCKNEAAGSRRKRKRKVESKKTNQSLYFQGSGNYSRVSFYHLRSFLNMFISDTYSTDDEIRNETINKGIDCLSFLAPIAFSFFSNPSNIALHGPLKGSCINIAQGLSVSVATRLIGGAVSLLTRCVADIPFTNNLMYLAALGTAPFFLFPSATKATNYLYSNTAAKPTQQQISFTPSPAAPSNITVEKVGRHGKYPTYVVKVANPKISLG